MVPHTPPPTTPTRAVLSGKQPVQRTETRLRGLTLQDMRIQVFIFMSSFVDFGVSIFSLFINGMPQECLTQGLLVPPGRTG